MDASCALYEADAAALLHAVGLDLQNIAQVLQNTQQCASLPPSLSLQTCKYCALSSQIVASCSDMAGSGLGVHGVRSEKPLCTLRLSSKEVVAVPVHRPSLKHATKIAVSLR